nr:iron ABC transporter permease [Pseudonocardia autotrophica]
MPGEPDEAADDLEHGRHRRHTLLWVGGLGIALIMTLPLAIALGPVRVPPGTVVDVVTHHLLGTPRTPYWTGAVDSIVWQVRVPRVLLGAIVGAGLALTGAALQAMVRNVLADPYILGVTAGASTGAAAYILFGFGVGAVFGIGSLTLSAFIGAVAATWALFLLARVGGQITSVRLLLAGVSIGYVLSAATSFLIFASSAAEGARDVLFWLLGSLGLASWEATLPAAIVVGSVLFLLILWGRRFDALAIGDDTARALGVSPVRFRVQALVVVSLCVGGVVAVAGGIGFVGLVIPHVARLCVGSAHRRLYPVAALIGASFLVWADVAARTVLAPRELPLGIVTAAVGAPLLFVLVRRFHPLSR